MHTQRYLIAAGNNDEPTNDNNNNQPSKQPVSSFDHVQLLVSSDLLCRKKGYELGISFENDHQRTRDLTVQFIMIEGSLAMYYNVSFIINVAEFI